MINWLVVAWVLLPFFGWNALLFTLKFNVMVHTFNNAHMIFLIFCWFVTALCFGIIL